MILKKHPGLDGGGAVAADADGDVYVAWHAPGDVQGEDNRKVWITRSHDQGMTFDEETAITDIHTGACGCCGMEIDASAKGQLLILFIEAREKVNRDMAVFVSQDACKTFKPLIDDPFKFNSVCVMSDVSFCTGGKRYAGRLGNREPGFVLHGSPRQDRQPPTIRSVPGDGGNLKHPAIAVSKDGSFVVVWAEGTAFNKGGSIAWQIFYASGNASGKIENAARGLARLKYARGSRDAGQCFQNHLLIAPIRSAPLAKIGSRQFPRRKLEGEAAFNEASWDHTPAFEHQLRF